MTDRTDIAVEDLHFRYGGSGGFAMHIPELAIPGGTRAALHGPSGSGKTTLLHLIAGILRPESGRIRIGDTEVTGLSPARARAYRIANLGFVFQDFALIDYLDVEHNVLYPYYLNPALRLTDDARARARELLDQLGLADKARRMPTRLSQGERQRVAICRALVTRPRILMADEPTGGLDPDRAASVMDLLDALVRERGISLVMVTHDHSLFPRFDATWDSRDWANDGGAR